MRKKPQHVETNKSTNQPALERSECLFCGHKTCGHKTPSTLFSVSRNGTIVVPSETGSFAAAEDFLCGRDTQDIQTYYDLVGALAPHNHLPGDDAVVRVFPNLTPALVSENSDENCLVVGLADSQWHECDIPDLPAEVIRGFIRAWTFLEAVCEDRGLVLVPFWNRGPAAGASVKCPHAQAYLLNGPPALYCHIAERREARQRCGVCEILAREDLLVWENKTFRLMADPAPEKNFTLFAAPKACWVSRLQEVDPNDLTEILVKATTAWRDQFGQMPDFNIAIRAGSIVGHLHLELIPRADTNPRINIEAGFELTSGDSIITVDPRDAAALKQRIPI